MLREYKLIYLYCTLIIIQSSYRINRLFVILYIIVSAYFIFARFIFLDNLEFLAFFEDDYFYYLETAKNFIQYGFPTLDYVTSTNGYHPLWFLIITLIQLVSTEPLYVSLTVSTIAFASNLFSFNLLKKYFIKTDYSDLSSIFLSITITSSYFLYFANGMEVVLIFPVIISILIKLVNDDNRALFLGGLFSLMILIRLDSIILFLLLFIYLVIKKKDVVRNIKFYLPFISIIVYLVINLIYFDTLMPVSGMAKQLKTSYMPVSNVIDSIFNLYLERIVFGVIPFILAALNFILIFLFRLKLNKSSLYLTINLFPFIFLAYNSVVSGWYLWSWYFYIFFPSVLVFVFILLDVSFNKKINRVFLIIMTLLVLSFLALYTYKQRPEKKLYYQNAIAVAEYEKTHPGVYAMGDRAGLVAYLIDSPVIQTEGLTMDVNYLDRLKKSLKLIDLLAEYNIDYYIASNLVVDRNSWIVEEPYKHHKYVITSLDTIYTRPYIVEDNKGWKYYIFKMK